jgi:hypothetical protein
MNSQLTEATAKVLQNALENAQAKCLAEVSNLPFLKTLFENPQHCFLTFAAVNQLSREKLLKKFETTLKIWSALCQF